MFKKILTFTMLIFVIVGLGVGLYFAVIPNIVLDNLNKTDNQVFANIQTKQVKVTEFFTYGRVLNFSGDLSNVSKDNFESAKLYLTDGNGFEKTYKLDGILSDSGLILTTTSTINNGLILDNLENGEYVVLVRIKTNNSVNPKFYSLENTSEYDNIEYHTITKENQNKKVNIEFKSKEYNGHEYKYLGLSVSDDDTQNEVYDFVIDAGHGGKDVGERSGADTEANITLEYAKLLREKLEEQGYKVKLTRDDSNTESYTSTNMYDENGRITEACKSKAKYMISFHINNGNKGLKGLEIYSPSKCDIEFAQMMANNIITQTDIEYSNNNSFKKGEGVYVRNFTQSVINEYNNTAKRKGYEPYNLTLDTPYLYTIREVGGIATNAYVDGRNKSYSANKYYNSNQGIECYQIEMGYIKNDLEIIKTQKEQFVTAISETVSNFLK